MRSRLELYVVLMLGLPFLGPRMVAAAQPGEQQDITVESPPTAPSEREDQLLVEFASSYFTRYRPSTALDMVNQIPGFQINNGGANRGFGGTTGNVLIDGKYPSTKQDRPTATLERIPASQVRLIELIRGQVRGIDLQGQAEVANVVLRNNTKAAKRWEAYFQHNNHGPVKPGAGISLTDSWAYVDYLVGLKYDREASGELGPEKIFDAEGVLVGVRHDKRTMTGTRLTGNLNASAWLGHNFTQFNGVFQYKTNNSYFTSLRVPQTAAADTREDAVDEQTDSILRGRH